MYIMKENMYYVCQMIILWRFYFQEDSLLQTKLTKRILERWVSLLFDRMSLPLLVMCVNSVAHSNPETVKHFS